MKAAFTLSILVLAVCVVSSRRGRGSGGSSSSSELEESSDSHEENCGCTKDTGPAESEVINKDQAEERLTAMDGVITSENYPSDYPKSHDQAWVIVAPEGHFIRLTFNDFIVEFKGTDMGEILEDSDCPHDFLALVNGNNTERNNDRRICRRGNPASMCHHGNILKIMFHTDWTFQFKGFNITYNVVTEC